MSYDGDLSLLGKCESFFRCVSTIPRCSQRVELMLFSRRFDGVAKVQ